MNPILTTCPVCEERMSITRLHCRNCDTTIEGHFDLGRFGRLSAEQMSFLETFVRCEGKLSRMEPELGMSYPALRARLNEIIHAKRSVTTDTALRLAQVTGMSAEFWLGLQQDWDLWHALRSDDADKIAQLEPLETTKNSAH